MPVSAALERVLPRLSETAAIDTFNAIAHQWLGHIVPIEVQSIEELDKAREHIHQLECALNKIDPFQAEVSATELADDLEVSKALKNIVDVKSASGEWYTITIPKNERALKADPHEAAWRLSHQAAHESVLSNPLNTMEKRKVAKALGAIISPVVMQDSVKKDLVTHELLKFKSRLCSAGDQVKRIQIARGIEDYAATHATISDNLQFKLMLSTATLGDVQDEQGRRVLPWRDGQDEQAQAATLRELQHRIACVASMAKQPEALTVARSLIAALYARRKEGITYGGQLTERVMLQGGLFANMDLEATAPEQPEVHADANVDGRSVYALVLTHNGGVVAHAVKKISTVVEFIDELGSVGNESVATERASQVATYAAEILRAYGHIRPPTDGPHHDRHGQFGQPHPRSRYSHAWQSEVRDAPVGAHPSTGASGQHHPRKGRHGVYARRLHDKVEGQEADGHGGRVPHQLQKHDRRERRSISPRDLNDQDWRRPLLLEQE